MRETLFQMQEYAGQSPFPTTIGHVTNAITFNTPHEGISPNFLLGSCKPDACLTIGCLQRHPWRVPLHKR